MPDNRANRWRNFSLRTLLVVVTQFAVAFAIAPICLQRYQWWQRDHLFDSLLELIVPEGAYPTAFADDHLDDKGRADENHTATVQ